ncbi:cysteine dioxygenase [Flexivirga alba]|uniref:Cysteine dioxygenase n=1 Tax=Flexivirga alba TaxID=702742 RepID=A0ABW2ADH1_9MICO
MTTIARSSTHPITPRDLDAITAGYADALSRFGYDETRPERQWAVLSTDDDVQVWAIAWPPGSATGWHDHGSAYGAFRVVQGTLREHVWVGYDAASDLVVGRSRHFTDRHIHDVRNETTHWAVSVHAYHPALQSMTRYEVRDDQLVLSGRDEDGLSW